MRRAERILVIDDDPSVVALWTDVLQLAGYAVTGFSDPVAAVARAIDDPHELVICDIEMPVLRGPALIERLLARHPTQQIIVLTAYGSVPSAVEMLRAGAADFVAKPCGTDTLVHVVHRALTERRLRRELVRLRPDPRAAPDVPGGIVARSPAMRRVLDRAERVAAARGPVLL